MKIPLKIAIIGATGNAGKRITEEALSRCHQVTGIVRDFNGMTAKSNLTLEIGEINNPYQLAGMLKGHDLVVSSVKFTDYDLNQLIRAIRLSGVKRFLVVEAASTLEVAPGLSSLVSGVLPDALIPIARAAQNFLDILRSMDDLDWTVLAPALSSLPGYGPENSALGANLSLTKTAKVPSPLKTSQ